MGDKFGRNYILLVELQNGTTLEIAPPFTIEFDITRNILTSANVCSIRIYNLSLFNRNQIEFNIYNQGAFRAVELIAGYGTNLAIIFFGNITQAWSVREGVNFITQIECFDGGYAINNAQTNLQIPAGTPNLAVIQTIAATLSQYNVEVGAISPTNFPGTSQRGKSYTGPSFSLLSDLTGGGSFIDNGFINCLGNSECLLGSIPLINAASGLLGTPVRENNLLTFDILFEPRVQAGQFIQLQSVTAQNFNGFYKVVSVKHRGMISQAVCGDAVTTLGMFLGQTGPQSLTTVPGRGA